MKKNSILTTFLTVLLSATLFAKTYDVSTNESVLKWKGTKVTGSFHDGTVKIKSGTVKTSRSGFSGEVVLNMSSIECDDLKEKPVYKKKLEGHLMSPDFFNVAGHPTAKIVIKKSSKKSGDNYTFTGDLTIKGITHEITFEGKITENNRKKISFTANIVIDRSKWEIKYNSKSFFDIQTLGDKLIKDEVEFTINLTATR